MTATAGSITRLANSSLRILVKSVFKRSQNSCHFLNRGMTSKNGDTFLYFGFGSNLLRERIQLRNPSAVFKTIGKVDGYKLTFNFFGPNWCGHVASIIEHEGECVWGCVWSLNIKDLPHLDDQEGVSHGIYRPTEVKVETPDGRMLTCRTYQVANPEPNAGRPSPQYLSVILKGAEQNNLPPSYMDKLKSIQHNGFSGKCELFDKHFAKLTDQL